MKKITSLFLISLLAATIVAAETGDTFDNETPPTPDYTALDSGSCDETLVEKKIADAVALAVSQAIEVQKNSCKLDPASCGIKVDDFISSVNVSELDTGWHLVGTSVDINGTTAFSSANIVWSYLDGKWSAYSSDTNVQAEIKNKSNIGIINNISANSGFWILKD